MTIEKVVYWEGPSKNRLAVCRKDTLVGNCFAIWRIALLSGMMPGRDFIGSAFRGKKNAKGVLVAESYPALTSQEPPPEKWGLKQPGNARQFCCVSWLHIQGGVRRSRDRSTHEPHSAVGCGECSAGFAAPYSILTVFGGTGARFTGPEVSGHQTETTTSEG